MRPFTLLLALLSIVFVIELGLEVVAALTGREPDPLHEFTLLAAIGGLLASNWRLHVQDLHRRANAPRR